MTQLSTGCLIRFLRILTPPTHRQQRRCSLIFFRSLITDTQTKNASGFMRIRTRRTCRNSNSERLLSKRPLTSRLAADRTPVDDFAAAPSNHCSKNLLVNIRCNESNGTIGQQRQESACLLPFADSPRKFLLIDRRFRLPGSNLPKHQPLRHLQVKSPHHTTSEATDSARQPTAVQPAADHLM